MPECPGCQSTYHEGDRYCGVCGTRLADPQFLESGARTQKSLNLVDVQYNLGLVYFKKEMYSEAIESWEKALEQDPGNEEIKDRIAEAKDRMQKSS